MDPILSNLLQMASTGLFYILLLAFVLHAVFVGYHWFTYGSSRSISLLAFAIYLSGGAIFLLILSIAQAL